MSWHRIEHKGEIFGQRYNSGDWLAEQLNKLNAKFPPVIIEHDPKNGVFEAVVWVDDSDNEMSKEYSDAHPHGNDTWDAIKVDF